MLILQFKTNQGCGEYKKDIINNNIKHFLCDKDDIADNKFDGSLEDTIVIGNIKASVGIKRVDFLSKIGYIIYLKDKKDLKNKYRDMLDKRLCNFSDYLSKNDKVIEMLRRCERFAKTESNILIEGETGTGKEILGQAIHMNSYRKDNAS